MEDKYNLKYTYDYKKVKKTAVIVLIAGAIQIAISIIAGQDSYMIVGVIVILTTIDNLKEATKEEMELKSLTIDDNGVSLETHSDTKTFKWKNVKSVKEFVPMFGKKSKPSVEIVTGNNESFSFSYRNFIKIYKIRKSLKYFCKRNNVEVAVK